MSMSLTIGGRRYRRRHSNILVPDDGGGDPSIETGVSLPRDPIPSSRPLRLSPTYETFGIDWADEDFGAGRDVFIRYRKAGENHWEQGRDMYPDLRTSTQTDFKLIPSTEVGVYRSLVTWLQDGESYVVEAQNRATGRFATATVTMHTWMPPLGPTIARLNSDGTWTVVDSSKCSVSTGQVLTVSGSGTPGAYNVIDLQGNTGGTTQNYKVIFTAASRYNALMGGGGTLEGAAHSLIYAQSLPDAITTANNGRAVLVVRDCIGQEYGRWAGGSYPAHYGQNENSFVYTTNSSTALVGRISVINNIIRNPNFRSNFWSEGDGPQGAGGHPNGPQAVTLMHCSFDQGRNVFAFNTVYCDNQRVFNDCFGGMQNRSMRGCPGSYFDICYNDVRDVADDPFEIDGPNKAGVIRGNKVQKTFTGGSNAPVIVGPCWWLCNWLYDSRRYDPAAIGVNTSVANDKDAGFKQRLDQGWGNGDSYGGKVGGGQIVLAHCEWPRLSTHTSTSNFNHKGFRSIIGAAGGNISPYMLNLSAFGCVMSGMSRNVYRGTDPSNRFEFNVLTGTTEMPTTSPWLPVDGPAGANRATPQANHNVTGLPTRVGGGVFAKLAAGSIGKDYVPHLPGLTPPWAVAGSNGKYDAGCFAGGTFPTVGSSLTP